MAYNPKDHYFKKAKQENYAARSVFKLEEIDQKLNYVPNKFGGMAWKLDKMEIKNNLNSF